MLQCAKENQQEWKWKLSWSTASKGKSSIPPQPSALSLPVIYAGFFFFYICRILRSNNLLHHGLSEPFLSLRSFRV